MIIRKKLFVLVGTAFFIAGFYLLIEEQWVYAAVSFLIGFWYFVQSVRQPGVGKRYKGYGSVHNDGENFADDSAGESSDSGSDGAGGGDD